jgi:hypothetical protein
MRRKFIRASFRCRWTRLRVRVQQVKIILFPLDLIARLGSKTHKNYLLVELIFSLTSSMRAFILVDFPSLRK